MAVGKTTNANIQKITDMYTERLRHLLPFETILLPDVKTGKNHSTAQQKAAEGMQFLNRISPSDHVILLDEKGSEYTSRQFADKLQKLTLDVRTNIFFVIGGPYGFSTDMYSRANGLISLSKMTFPHELIRAFFVEQLYRACTIRRNMPYHHD